LIGAEFLVKKSPSHIFFIHLSFISDFFFAAKDDSGTRSLKDVQDIENMLYIERVNLRKSLEDVVTT